MAKKQHSIKPTPTPSTELRKPDEAHLHQKKTSTQDSALNTRMELEKSLTNITGQKQTESELHRLTRALIATNPCNQAVIHSTDEMELLQKICSIMVDVGGYRMAWVGYADQDDEKSIRTVAQAGFENGYLKSVRLTWADVPLGQGPTGTAIRTGMPYIMRDMQSDQRFEPWRNEALKRGYASSQSLPLKTDKEVFGAITIYSELPNAFDGEETTLLTALADNLAYGITSLRSKKANQTAEEKIKQSEERFRVMFEKHSAIKMVIDPVTGKIINANQAAADFYGWSVEELRTMHIQQINTLSPEQVKSEMEKSRLSVKKQFVFQHRKADGSLRDVEVFSNLIAIEGKNLLYSIVHDITDRKLAESKTEEIKERYEATIEAAQIGTWDWNVQTGETIFNTLWFEIVGYTLEELAPVSIQTWIDLSHPDDFNTSTAIIEKHFNGELEHYECECRMKHKNGHWVWVLDRGKLLTRTPDGKPLRMLGTHTDITGRKNILTELIAAKEHAEESDRLKSAFLANISHEIRTPMNGILGFSALLKEPHLTGEEQEEYLDLIEQSGQRMLNLINDLIDISRIEAGETKLQITPTTVNKVLHDLYAFFMPAISNKKLQLHCTLGLPDNESIIETDSGKLAQILTNLIQNALKFTRTGTIDFGYTRQGTTLEFYVTDTGIGIPDDMQQKIFDRFRQVDNTLTRNHEGSGLGLSISKAYVAMLGGKISVQSQEGMGSTFTFTLPYIPLNSQNPSALSTQHFLSQDSTLNTLFPAFCILIVEDDEVSTLLLKRTLKNENSTLLCAVNGLEAVEIVQHHPEINLVLMDLQLPIMNGFEATKLIKQQRPDLPVIAQSAFASKEDKQKAREAGCSSYITKPINKTELLNLITQLREG